MLSCFKNLKSHAVGDDNIQLKFLKIIFPYILSPLTHIINHCFTTSCFPRQWKTGLVIPIPKKPSAVQKNDFRPITILPCLSKIIEKIIEQQIAEFFDQNSLLSEVQSGFRPKHSCATALMKIVDDILLAYDNNELILLCLLDFSKAFDSIVHKMLLKKLRDFYNFDHTAIKLIESYLEKRSQRVKVGNNISNPKSISCGVPQGSILGPLLFSIYLNDLFSVCENVSMHAYADDVQIYISRPPGLIEDLCCRMSEDLAAISNWARLNGLSLNTNKSCILPIKRTGVHFDELPNITLNSDNLKLVDKVSNLGFVLNSTLTPCDHVNNVVKRIYYTLRTLRLSASYTPFEVRKRLALQLIMPIISYAETVYCKLDSASMHKLQVAFNHVTRYVFGVDNFDHISPWSKSLLGVSLQEYFDMRNCLFLHNLVYNRTPNYLYKKIEFLSCNRSKLISVRMHNYKNTSRHFFITTIRIWNGLP